MSIEKKKLQTINVRQTSEMLGSENLFCYEKLKLLVYKNEILIIDGSLKSHVWLIFYLKINIISSFPILDLNKIF